MITGLNFKLDVGLYRLDQQVACQRYRQNFIDANTSISELVNNILAKRDLAKDRLVEEVASLFAPQAALV